jgi:ubiquinone/menaquinone biosynthesis C-methylase UbiE
MKQTTLKSQLSTFNILSIGCGAAWWEIKSIFEKPVDKIYLLDPNTEVLNKEDVEEGISYFSKIFNKPFPASFELLIQEAKEIPLENSSIDEIWFFNSLHEINEVNTCLQECHRLLKSGGQIFMEEELSEKEQLFHEGCHRPLYFFDDIKKMMQASGLQFYSIEKKDEVAFYIRFQKP